MIEYHRSVTRNGRHSSFGDPIMLFHTRDMALWLHVKGLDHAFGYWYWSLFGKIRLPHGGSRHQRDNTPSVAEPNKLSFSHHKVLHIPVLQCGATFSSPALCSFWTVRIFSAVGQI